MNFNPATRTRILAHLTLDIDPTAKIIAVRLSLDLDPIAAIRSFIAHNELSTQLAFAAPLTQS